MLQKCANPACTAPFRSLHEGKLFVAESFTSDLDGFDGNRRKTRKREHFWLCGACSAQFTLHFDADPWNADPPPQRTRRTSPPTVPACSSPWRLRETNGFPVLKTPSLLALRHRRLPPRWLVPHNREPLARPPQDFHLAFFAGDAKGNEERLLTAASQNADWPLARRRQHSSSSGCGHTANPNCQCSWSTGLRSRPQFCRVSARRIIRSSGKLLWWLDRLARRPRMHS